MTRYTERDLWVPTLRRLAHAPGGLSTSQLIPMLVQDLEPDGPDVRILANRRDTHFSQIVRNLISHETLEKRRLISYRGARQAYSITAAGRRFLSDAEPAEDALVAQGMPLSEIRRERRRNYRDLIVEEGVVTVRSTVHRARSRSLRQAAIAELKVRTGGSLICEVCGFDFATQYGTLGHDFIEMHHATPLHTTDPYVVAISKALDEGRLVPLCANCHRMAHRPSGASISVADLRRVLGTGP